MLGKSVSQDSPILQFDTTPPQSHSIFLNTPQGCEHALHLSSEDFHMDSAHTDQLRKSAMWILSKQLLLNIQVKQKFIFRIRIKQFKSQLTKHLKTKARTTLLPSDVWNPMLLRTTRSQNLVIFVFSNKLNVEAKEICRHWGQQINRRPKKKKCHYLGLILSKLRENSFHNIDIIV